MLRYAITDGTAKLPAGEDDRAGARHTIEQAARLAGQGVAFLLVREKHLSPAALVAFTREIVQAVRTAAPAGPPGILVPGRVDVALAAGADGVHLSSAPGELTPQQVRALLPGAVVSVSCHTDDEVRRAHHQQASLALFAPVFGKWVNGVQVAPAAGLHALEAACEAGEGMPVFALGGVTAANTPQCLAAGAAGIAAIRMFFGATSD